MTKPSDSYKRIVPTETPNILATMPIGNKVLGSFISINIITLSYHIDKTTVNDIDMTNYVPVKNLKNIDITPLKLIHKVKIIKMENLIFKNK